MKAVVLLVFFLLSFFLCFSFQATTEDEEALEAYLKNVFISLHPEHDITEIEKFTSIAPDAYTSGRAMNAKGPFHKIISGEDNEFVIAFKNHWIQPLHIVGVSGYITAPDFSYIVRNITMQRQYGFISPNETISLIMRINPDFEATALGLLIVVDFTDAKMAQLYRTVVYKELIEIVAPSDSAFDYQSIILYFILCGLLASGFYFVKKRFPKAMHKKNS